MNSLDARLGDGDLGVSLTRGGRSLLAELPSLPDDDLGSALGKCAQAITRISGSTCGTLFATGLLSVAKTSKGRREIPWSEMSVMLSTAIEGMSRRGNCRLGDKTVLDAVEAARCAMEGIQDPKVLVALADKAVADAVEHYKHRPSLARPGSGGSRSKPGKCGSGYGCVPTNRRSVEVISDRAGSARRERVSPLKMSLPGNLLAVLALGLVGFGPSA